MASDSEHTNRPRPPQQAQGRTWPIIVLLLGVVTLALALTACGGPSSTSTPGATTGGPATATSTPASTPPPAPTKAAKVGESAGISRETREYLEAYCSLVPAEQPDTWGGVVDQTQKDIDFHEKNEPPSEMRDYAEADLAIARAFLKVATAQDSSAPFSSSYLTWSADSEDSADTEFLVALEALDDAVLEALGTCS